MVIVLADDLGFSDIGAYGASRIRTPHLDRLARNGLRFTRFYHTGRCSPTRASLLTGLYPHRTGVGRLTKNRGKPGYLGHLNDRCVTIAEVLNEKGYFTALAGKWHVTPFNYEDETGSHRASWPLQRGFNRFTGALAGGGNYFHPAGFMKQNEWREPGDDFYYTRAISDASVRFIREAEDRSKPLFLYVAYTAPHWPLHALVKDIKTYRKRFRDGWEVLRRERFEHQRKLGLADATWSLTEPPGAVPAWADVKNLQWQARRMAVYAAMVHRMDIGVGRIVRVLEDTGRLENTLLMFLSDNGAARYEPAGEWLRRFAGPDQDPSDWGTTPDVMPGGPETFQGYGPAWANVSNTPFRKYKKFTHEGGVATPLIVHWPSGIDDRGAFRHQVGHVIDLMPTVLDATDVSYPDRQEGRAVLSVDGRSLVPSFRGEETVERTLYWEHAGHRAVRKGNWKAVSLKWEGGWKLYNLSSDRSETRNLADRHPDRVERFRNMWNDWARRTNVVPRPAGLND